MSDKTMEPPEEMQPLEQLNPNPRNPRVITDERVQALQAALLRFGDLGGIVYNLTTARLVGGHQRLRAFESAGGSGQEIHRTEVLVEPDAQGTVCHGYVIANGTRYAYREVRWNEATETAAMLAANKFSGEWEWEGVSKLLQELSATGGIDMSLTGFEQHELDTLLNAEWKVPAVSNEPPPASEEGKVDKLYLTPSARAALDQCKKMLEETDDAKTIERVCNAYVLANGSIGEVAAKLGEFVANEKREQANA